MRAGAPSRSSRGFNANTGRMPEASQVYGPKDLFGQFWSTNCNSKTSAIIGQEDIPVIAPQPLTYADPVFCLNPRAIAIVCFNPSRSVQALSSTSSMCPILKKRVKAVFCRPGTHFEGSQQTPDIQLRNTKPSCKYDLFAFFCVWSNLTLS